MAGLVVNGGLDYLDSVTVASDCSSWQVALYSNNHTPGNTDTLGTYTLVSGSGIGTQVPGFTVASAGAGSKTITSALMNFICTASLGVSAYGYCVFSSGGTLIWAELFSGGPYALTAAGDGVQLTVVLTDQN